MPKLWNQRRSLQDLGCQERDYQGGHEATPDKASDFVLLAGRASFLSAPRVDTVRTHGTGDTLSSCITAELAKGQDLSRPFALVRTT